ncbi:FAD dependent oxidoreductase [Aspergillus karnatakaensis]|uniref:NAD(P)/FAD-dependent oxidoreductase n=1 Tax=Aspergillus karnatakaensis TaxID=1810916 RepID=UPI003CCDC823
MEETHDEARWLKEFEAKITSGQRAPNPAAFPEPSHLSNSYWIQEYPIDFEDKWVKAPAPDTVDVAIIGSGITGATAAYKLAEARPELKVALFEARGLCTGATGRNGGHMGRPDAHGILALAEAFGVEEALRIRRFNGMNRELMLKQIEDLDAVEEVELSLKGTLIVFETEEERQAYLQDEAYAKEHGHKLEGFVVDSEWIRERANVDPSSAQYGGAYLERSGTIFPRKFVALLLRKALERAQSLSLHPYTPVSEVTYDPTAEGAQYGIVTTKGTTKAKVVFHATNAYASHLVPAFATEKGVLGCTAHMLGVTPNRPETCVQLEGGFGYASFWHWMLQRPNKGPYLYGLATAEQMGDYNDTITLEQSHPARGRMLNFLSKVFPHSFSDLSAEKDVCYDWKGVQGFTADGCSIVGRPVAERRGEFASVGHNGEGMGRCFACATVATEAMIAELDQKTDWEPPAWFPLSYRRNL